MDFVLHKHCRERPICMVWFASHVVISWPSVGNIKSHHNPNSYYFSPQFVLALEAALLGFYGIHRSSLLWLSCALIQCCICLWCVVLNAILSGWVLTLQLVEIIISLGSLSMYSSFGCLHGLLAVLVFSYCPCGLLLHEDYTCGMLNLFKKNKPVGDSASIRLLAIFVNR